MKIVLLDTGRGVNPDTIRMWRENLQLTDDDTVALMAWQPPREPLPVTEHYVFGPRLSLRATEPRHVQTVDDIFGGHDIDAAELAARDAQTGALTAHATEATDDADDAEIGGEDSPMSESDLAGQLPEAVAETGDHSAHWESGEYGDDASLTSPDGDTPLTDTASPDGTPLSEQAATSVTEGTTAPTAAPERERTNPAHLKVAHLPVTDPRRVAHALTWRAKKATRTGKRALRFAKRSLKAGNNPVAKAAQQAIATKNGSISTQFAIALARSREAAELFREADLVFPVDARSQRGAWLLARANPGPDVMVGYPAAIRALERRRATT